MVSINEIFTTWRLQYIALKQFYKNVAWGFSENNPIFAKKQDHD
jgi:hypothetical protein